jgi:cytochrome c oxidase subunit 2
MDISNRNSPEQDQSPSIVPGAGFMLGFGAFCIIGAAVIALLSSSGTLKILPDQASVQARNTDTLFYILLAIGGFVFFLVQGLLIYSVVRFRAQANDTSDGANIHGSAVLEIVWTVIPSVVVVIIAGLSFVIWTQNNEQMENRNIINGASVPIEVAAQQFVWRFDYLTGVQDVNGNNIILQSPDLHTYANQNVDLQMFTQDLIHSFWVPAMRVKQDVIPGRRTEIRFTPVDVDNGTTPWQLIVGPATIYAEPVSSSRVVTTIREQEEGALTLVARRINVTEDNAWTQVELEDGGTGWVASDRLQGEMDQYRIVCAELCGGGHGQMFTHIYVHKDEASFLLWYQNNVDARKVPPNDPVLLGEQLLASGAYPCSGCHALESLGWVGPTGPNLNGIADKAITRAGATGLPGGADYILQSVWHSQAYLVPGAWTVVMPVFSAETNPNFMPPEDAAAITAFLCSQTVSGNPTDNTCGLVFGSDGTLEDVDATNLQLEALTETYR